MKTKHAFFLQIVVITALVTSCNSPNGPVNNSITLSAEVSCTEAWLKLSANNISLPRNVTITRDGSSLFNFTLTTKDTTLYDSTLTPNKSYTYQALLSPLGGQSNKVVATTLDTTSHNFSWQTFTFGDPGAGSSTLNDVAIINDTLAYAVGTIYLNDKNGNPDPQPYCLAKWNGKTWSLKKLYYKDKDYQGNEFTSVLSNIRGVFAFNNADIWLAAGSVFHWNGTDSITEFSYHTLTPSGLLPGINKLWGTSSSNLYGVGNSGSIIHYTNGSWQKIESNVSSEFTFYDVYGKNEASLIYFVAATLNGNNKIIWLANKKLEHTQFDEISTLRSIWYANNNKLYLAGSYFFIYVNGKWRKVQELSNQTTTTVRGTGSNDVVVVGTRGIINHYNGATWHTYQTLGEYSSVAIKGNTVVAVGSSTGSEAFIATGKK